MKGSPEMGLNVQVNIMSCFVGRRKYLPRVGGFEKDALIKITGGPCLIEGACPGARRAYASNSRPPVYRAFLSGPATHVGARPTRDSPSEA